MGAYDDLLNQPRPESRRPKMPRAERAKQFMPFAALRGFDDVIDDRAALRALRRQLSEDELTELDDGFRSIAAAVARGGRPAAELTVFTPDPARWTPETPWGAYHTVTGAVDKVYAAERELRLDGIRYALDRIDGIRMLTTDEKML